MGIVIDRRKEIKVPHGMALQLSEDFGVTPQAVRNALRDISKSENAKRIRAKAIELLKKELDEAEI